MVQISVRKRVLVMLMMDKTMTCSCMYSEDSFFGKVRFGGGQAYSLVWVVTNGKCYTVCGENSVWARVWVLFDPRVTVVTQILWVGGQAGNLCARRNLFCLYLSFSMLHCYNVTKVKRGRLRLG